MFAHDLLPSGNDEVIVAGAMEFTNAPYLGTATAANYGSISGGAVALECP